MYSHLKESPKLKDLKAFDKNFQLKESNAFSKSIAIINSGNWLILVYSMMSSIDRTVSNIVLFLTYTFWSSLITKGNTFSNLNARAFEAILVSTFNKEMGRQFLM